MASSLPPAERVLCSWCARPWLSPRYKTCDDCRERAANRGRLMSRLLAPVQERTDVPLPAPPLPPPPHAPEVSTLRERCSDCGQPWLSVQFKTCETCRRKNRRSGRNTGQSAPWWERLSHIPVVPFCQDWTKRCSFCAIALLSHEPDAGAATRAEDACRSCRRVRAFFSLFWTGTAVASPA